MLANILDGIMNAISMGSLLANLMGVTLGIIFGALPGLTAAMGVALLIPPNLRYARRGSLFRVARHVCGAIYGGCITAILVGTPGYCVRRRVPCLKAPPSRPAENPAGLWTWLTIASFVGGIVSALALIFIAPMLARAAMSFGAPEYFAVAVFGLTVVASLSFRASRQRAHFRACGPVPRHYRPRSRNGGHAQYLSTTPTSSTACLWFPCLSAYSPSLKCS